MRAKQSSLLLLVLAAAIAGCGGSSAPADTAAVDSSASETPTDAGAVDVDLREWAVLPSKAQIDQGSVEFNAVNKGDVPHELVLLKTDTAAAALKTDGPEAEEEGNVAGVEDIAAGESKPLSADLRPGHYVLLCNLPGHYSDGMFADIVIK